MKLVGGVVVGCMAAEANVNSYCELTLSWGKHYLLRANSTPQFIVNRTVPYIPKGTAG